MDICLIYFDFEKSFILNLFEFRYLKSDQYKYKELRHKDIKTYTTTKFHSTQRTNASRYIGKYTSWVANWQSND